MRGLWSHLAARIRRPGTGERRLRIILGTTVLVVALVSAPAWADPGLSWMGPTFDVTDSHHVRLSQYELSMDDGGITHPIKGVSFWIIQLVWTGHLGLVGLLGGLLDWTVSLTWVPWLAGPVADIQKLLHDRVLAPVGATAWGGGVLALLMVIAGGLAGIRILRGRTSGWWDIVRAAVASALAVGFFAAPVTGIVGDGTHLAEPLAASQRIGTAMSQMIGSGGRPSASVGGTQTVTVDGKGHPVFTTGQTTKVSSMLVDSFVRPIHQQLNYGAVIDGTRCQSAYDAALKAGPHGGDAKDQRQAVKGCDSKYGDYADSAAAASWLVGFSYYELGMIFMMILLVLFTVVTWYYIGKLLWSALVSMIDVLKAIPGHTEPLLRDIVSISYALIFYVTSLAVLSGILKIIGAVFASGGNLAVKFLVVDLVVIIGIAVLVTHLVNHHRGEARMRDRLKNLFRAKDRASSMLGTAARRAGSLAGHHARSTAMRRLLGHSAPAPLTRSGRPPQVLPPDRQSEGSADQPGHRPARRPGLARRAAGAAATAMSGGAAVAARKAVALTGAYRTMRTGGGITPGHHRATTTMMAVTARAHNYLADKRHAAEAITRQTRTGAQVRSTTGIRALDSAARTAGTVAIAGETAVLKARTRAAKTTVPITTAARTMARPAAATARTTRAAITRAKDRAHNEITATKDWAKITTAPLAAITAPPTRIGPQPPPADPTPTAPQLQLPARKTGTRHKPPKTMPKGPRR